jgi:hypothetical protein
LIDKTEEIQAPSKPCTKSYANRFPIQTVHLELVEGENKEIDERQVELGEENENTQEMKQQLKKGQHVITQFYQENEELRRCWKKILLKHEIHRVKKVSYPLPHP